MSGTPFDFLRREFPELHREALEVGLHAIPEPRTACFYARRVVEQAIKWAFAHDRSLTRPYDDAVSTLLHEPSFRNLMDDRVFKQTKEVIRLGNRAVHDGPPPSQHDSVAATAHLFEFCYWFARTYSRGEKPPAGLRFDPKGLPRRLSTAAPPDAPTAAQMREVETRLYDTVPHHLGPLLRRHPPLCPVSFVGGTRSLELRQVGLAATQRLVRDRLRWVEGSHLFPMERPLESAAIVLDLLKVG